MSCNCSFSMHDLWWILRLSVSSWFNYFARKSIIVIVKPLPFGMNPHKFPVVRRGEKLLSMGCRWRQHLSKQCCLLQICSYNGPSELLSEFHRNLSCTPSIHPFFVQDAPVATLKKWPLVETKFSAPQASIFPNYCLF